MPKIINTKKLRYLEVFKNLRFSYSEMFKLVWNFSRLIVPLQTQTK